MYRVLKLIFSVISLYIMAFNLSIKAENNVKIIYNIGDTMITNIDIKNQYRFLLLIDKNFSKLDEKQGLEIAKQESINDKIKTNELKKTFDLDKNYDLIDDIINQHFKKNNINSNKEIKKHLKDYNLEYEYLQKKFQIDQLWRELIVLKFSKKINIDEEKIKKRISKRKLTEKKSFLLSEILFELKDSEILEQRFEEIKKSISEKGFDVSASLFSISESSKSGGKIGWIDENQFSEKILKNINILKINDITKPIKVSSGFLIIKLEDVKKVKQAKNLKAELNKIILFEKNRQYNEFSNIFFEKLKINTFINER